MTHFDDAFRLSKSDYTVQETGVRIGRQSMVNLLLPGERAELTLHLASQGTAIHERGTFEVIRYRTTIPEGADTNFKPAVYAMATLATQPLDLDIAAGGTQDVVIQPAVGEEFGGYAIILDVPGHGRTYAASMARSLVPDTGRVQFPTYALDATWPGQMNEGVFAMFDRLGVKGMRLETPFNEPGSAAEKKATDLLHQDLEWAHRYDVAVMLTLEGGNGVIQPLGQSRPWLDDGNQMLKTKSDMAWLPQYDDAFQQWVHGMAKDYGWPRGNVNAMELWNEPWESTSISGWGADIPRYQEIFTHMAQGIEAARADSGSKVLIGGLCSSANARDKLFADGTEKYLKWMDFISIHYQPLAADPVLVPEWMHRKSEYGPMRVWDTESWIANSEDRFAGVIASMRAQGQSRTAGIYGGNVYHSENVKLNGHVYPVIQMYAPAAAVAAATKFIGQRDFTGLVFGKGLPWVFAFDGLQGRSDDGTMVVVGDLRKDYEADRVLFRSVRLAEGASLELHDPQHVLRLYDFYGNPIPASETIAIPLDGRGFFLRASGAPGSFAKAQDIVRRGTVRGVEPAEIVAHDMTTPVSSRATLRVTLTNVLNVPVTGSVRATSSALTITDAGTLTLAPHETRDVTMSVSGTPTADNVYPVHLEFAAAGFSPVMHDEAMHVNLIARRTIHVDGDLSDWNGVLPQVLPGVATSINLAEKAYLPYADFGSGTQEGFSTAYLAYDDTYFYFAAKVADATEDAGLLRYATRDDDDFFYPATVTDARGQTKTWPEGVRHYSYRKKFNIPSSGALKGGDNVQIAFNVLNTKPWVDAPPNTLPHFITYWDTDYEFALNKVARQYGGGYEVWRLSAPGVPRKSFYPRQGKAAVDGGAVNDALLSVVYRNGVRYVEAAIPWHEIPEVRQRILAGETIKFSCRINDDAGPSHELATGRSVSKMNSFTFHNDWQTHWSNELEFGSERK